MIEVVNRQRKVPVDCERWQEFVVKAFLMEIHQTRKPDEGNRHPTWVSPEEARKRLATEQGGENILRIRIFRIRARLRICMDTCVNQGRIN